MNGSADLKAVLHRITGIVRYVGNNLRRACNRDKKISYKGEVDLITRFDRHSQRQLVSGLKKLFPDHGILCEENIHHNRNAAAKWIIDPLDGTTNFAHDLPIWAVSIGLELDNEIVLGVVFDPTRQEMFSAIKGAGAYLNDERIRVSRVRSLDKSLLVTGFPYDIRRSRHNNLRYFCDFAVRAQAVRRLGSAALDLCYTACGRFDGYWELKLSPWDQAAGHLILREAGGRVTDFHGKKFSIYGNEVLGTNGLIHNAMMSVLAPTKKRT